MPANDGEAHLRMTLSGARQLEKIIDDIVADQGPKAVNKELRQVTRQVCREILLPAAQDLVPEETGFLRQNLRVRSTGRSRTRVGHYVGFPDPLFKGDTFYGAFHEFGYRVGKRGFKGVKDTRSRVARDSFLRRPLYENEGRIRRVIEQRFVDWAEKLNRTASDA